MDRSTSASTFLSVPSPSPVLKVEPPTPTVPFHPVPIRSLGNASAILEQHEDCLSSASTSASISAAVSAPPPDVSMSDLPILASGPGAMEDLAFAGGKAPSQRTDSRHHPYGAPRRHRTESATSSSSAQPEQRRAARSSQRSQDSAHSRTISSASSTSSAGLDLGNLGLSSSSQSSSQGGGSLYGGSGDSGGDSSVAYIDPAMLLGANGAAFAGFSPGTTSYALPPQYYSGDSSYGDSDPGSRYTPSPQPGATLLQYDYPQGGALYDPSVGYLAAGGAGAGVAGDDRKSSIATVRPPAKKQSKAKVSHARKQEPGHIKRPKNAFIIFRSAFCQSDRVEKHGITDHRHISRIAGQVWKKMGPEEKRPYEIQADEEKRQHREQNPQYRYKPTARGKDGGGAPVVKRRRRDRLEGEEEEEERRCMRVAELLALEKNGHDPDALLKMEANELLAQGAGGHLSADAEQHRKRSIKIGDLLTVHPGERGVSRPGSAVPETPQLQHQSSPACGPSKPSKSKRPKKPATPRPEPKQQQRSPHASSSSGADIPLDGFVAAPAPAWPPQHIPVSAAWSDVPAEPFAYAGEAYPGYGFAEQGALRNREGGDLMIVEGSEARRMNWTRWAMGGDPQGGQLATTEGGDVDVFQINNGALHSVFAQEADTVEPVDRYLNPDMIDGPTPPHFSAPALSYQSPQAAPPTLGPMMHAILPPGVEATETDEVEGPFFNIDHIAELHSLPVGRGKNGQQYVFLDPIQANNLQLIDKILNFGYGVTFEAPAPAAAGGYDAAAAIQAHLASYQQGASVAYLS